MLRKLFISLIILSVLASEGFVNLPGYLFALNTDINAGAGVLDAEGAPSGRPLSMEESILPSALGSDEGLFTLSQRSVQKIAYNVVIPSENDEDNTFENLSPAGFLYPYLPVKGDRGIIVRLTDSSPPYTAV